MAGPQRWSELGRHALATGFGAVYSIERLKLAESGYQRFADQAANVLVASQSQVTGGLPTWSIATAYQSAFFSMEAMLLMLGVAVVEVNNKTLVFDIWPEVESSLSKKLKAQYKLGSEIQFVHHSRLEHHHRWAILKRVLRTLSNSPIAGAVINAINEIDDKEFARQRNRLH